MEQRLQRPQRKKKKHYGKVACGCLALLLAGGLFFDFGGFGSGLGLPTFQQGDNGDSNGYEAPPPPTDNTPLVTPSPSPETTPEPPPYSGHETPLLEIRVSGSTITHGDQELTLDELRTLLEGVSHFDYTWDLFDERAIDAYYEEVRNLFAELSIAVRER